MVGTVFGKFGFKIMLGGVLGIGAKGHVLHNVGGFVDIFAAHVAVTSPKLEFKAHNGCVGYINQ